METHNIQTEDNYILELHRIPHGKQTDKSTQRQNSLQFKDADKSADLNNLSLVTKSYKIENTNKLKKPLPVLLIHCLLCSSADFIYFGPSRSLGYILADNGFDVWMGNNRGNVYSRNHSTLNPDERNGPFWDFSLHELGNYDIPAMIDHVLNVTGEEKLYLIGFSQGGVTSLITLSSRPEYNKKIRLLSAFAPAVYPSNALAFRVTTFGIWPIAGPLMSMLGTKEVLPRQEVLLEFLGKNFCSDESYLQTFCTELMYMIGGPNSRKLNKSWIPVIFYNTPAGTSWGIVDHFTQLVETDEFKRYDYGPEINQKLYGSTTAPFYELRNVKVPVAIYYGEGDIFVDVSGILKLYEQLPNSFLYKLPDPQWSHVDFIWSEEAQKILYPKTIEVMKKYSGD